MPQQIVDNYRLLYKKYFLKQAFELKFGSEIKVPAYYSEEDKVDFPDFFDQKHSPEGFPDVNIFVKYDDVSKFKNGVWAANTVRLNPNGNVESASILINPRLTIKQRTFKREVLAHEFIETMSRIRDKESEAQMKGRELLSMLLELRSRMCIQQDPEEYRRVIDTAVEGLLVSRPSLDEIADELNITIDEIAQLLNINETPMLIAALNFINDIEEMFSMKWAVNQEIVSNRITAEITEMS